MGQSAGRRADTAGKPDWEYSYERLFVKFYLRKNRKKVDNQQKMIQKRYAFVLLLFAFCNASAKKRRLINVRLDASI